MTNLICFKYNINEKVFISMNEERTIIGSFSSSGNNFYQLNTGQILPEGSLFLYDEVISQLQNLINKLTKQKNSLGS